MGFLRAAIFLATVRSCQAARCPALDIIGWSTSNEMSLPVCMHVCEDGL